MQTAISDFTQGLIQGKRSNANGWISFNAVCCHHRGERMDTRRRAGIHPNPDGSLTYSCFNCKFKASYRPGLDMGFGFRKLLRWMGANENDILRLSIEAMRLKDLLGPPADQQAEPKKEYSFEPRSLPPNTGSLLSWARSDNLTTEQEDQLVAATQYLISRGIDPLAYGDDFMLTTDTAVNMHRRIIVPYYWKRKLIGYTARALDDTVRPKYMDAVDAGFVYNIDSQRYDREFVLVMEGPFDAYSLDGVAIMGSKATDQQIDIINSLDRDVIVVPHADKDGAYMVNQAIELGWQASFPVWLETCKDANEAVVKYGKLFVMKSILDSIEHSSIRIKLKLRTLLRG